MKYFGFIIWTRSVLPSCLRFLALFTGKCLIGHDTNFSCLLCVKISHILFQNISSAFLVKCQPRLFLTSLIISIFTCSHNLESQYWPINNHFYSSNSQNLLIAFDQHYRFNQNKPFEVWNTYVQGGEFKSKARCAKSERQPLSSW